MGLEFNEAVTRLVLAMVLGAIMGGERKLSRKNVGIRTHSIICVSCTMLTIVSAYGFQQFQGNSDPSRLISNVLTGIGFLCGGVIYVVSIGENKQVRGLTTAAEIWGSAMLGIPIGLGLYKISIVTFLILLFVISVDRTIFIIRRFLEKKNIIKTVYNKEQCNSDSLGE